MRDIRDRGPFYPGVIFRQGAQHGAMWNGQTSYWQSYGAAEAYLLARKDGKHHTEALAAANAYQAQKDARTAESARGGMGGMAGMGVGY